MNALAQHIIDAHGGLARWTQFRQLSARLHQGGALWALKGYDGQLVDTTVTVGLGELWASHRPFLAPGSFTRFEPGRVAILKSDGTVADEALDPRASFAGHTLTTPWTPTQLAYFAGCAMWTYLNMPFLLAAPDVQCETLSPWEENGQTWQRLRVTLPDRIATHSSVQTLYADAQGLLQRHDYDVEIAGNTPGAHYISDYVQVQGLQFPTRRRIFPRGPDQQSMPEPLVVSIDLSDFVLV